MRAHAPTPHVTDPHGGTVPCHCDYTRPGLEPWWEELPAGWRCRRCCRTG